MRILRQALAVAACSDSESSRYALGGALIERIGDDVCCAVACDGRILAYTQWKEDQETPRGELDKIILSEQTCKKAARLSAPTKKVRDLGLDSTANFVTLDEPSLNGTARISGIAPGKDPQTIEEQTIEGRFPNWRGVFPAQDSEKETTIVLDPVLLTRLLSAVATAGGVIDGARGVAVTFRDPKSPVTVGYVSKDGTTRAAGVIMPLEPKGKRGGEHNTAKRCRWQPVGMETEGGAK